MASAVAASSWLAMPNSGHSALMPPAGSITPAIEEVAPAATNTALVSDVRAVAGPRAPGEDLRERVLQHVAADAGPGVERRQDEQRLEHDGEVVPERRERSPPSERRKISAMPTARQGAPPMRPISVFSPTRAARAAISARP